MHVLFQLAIDPFEMFYIGLLSAIKHHYSSSSSNTASHYHANDFILESTAGTVYNL